MVCDMLCGAVAEVCDNVEEVVHAYDNAVELGGDNVVDSGVAHNVLAHSDVVVAELQLPHLLRWPLPKRKQAYLPTT